MKLKKQILILKSVFTDAWKYISGKKYLEKKVKNYIILPEKIFNGSKPVFVLSTGRTGTELLTRLFALDENIEAYHEPKPQMVYAAKIAYESYTSNISAKKLAFLSSRYDSLKTSYLRSKRYVETNHNLTFFADAIYNLLPQSKFIHLVRNPASFVRSGMRRNYYKGHDYDDGRILPRTEDISSEQWKAFDQLEKIAWLWNATNQFIENLKELFSEDRIITVRSEDLFNDPNTFLQISDFINIEKMNKDKLKKLISKPKNFQYKGEFPKYEDWDNKQKNKLKNIATLAKKYNYQL